MEQDEHGQTLLHISAWFGHVETIDWVDIHDIDQRDYRGNTSLHHAIDGQSFEAVKLLLCHGANPNARDEFGQPALLSAILKEDVNIAFLLLNHGADPNLGDWTGFTSFMFSVMMNDSTFAQACLMKGAKIEQTDTRGFTAYYYAKQSRRLLKPTKRAYADIWPLFEPSSCSRRFCQIVNAESCVEWNV